MLQAATNSATDCTFKSYYLTPKQETCRQRQKEKHLFGQSEGQYCTSCQYNFSDFVLSSVGTFTVPQEKFDLQQQLKTQNSVTT